MIGFAVGARGGDFAPRQVVAGALAAARHFDLGIALVGGRSAIEAELGRHGDTDPSRVRIIESTDVITMDESPLAALRRKPGAAIRLAGSGGKRGAGPGRFSG